MMYAAQIVDGMVAQVIVGDSAWAIERLGGVWVDTVELVGIGWAYEDGEFVPPAAEEPEPDEPSDG